MDGVEPVDAENDVGADAAQDRIVTGATVDKGVPRTCDDCVVAITTVDGGIVGQPNDPDAVVAAQTINDDSLGDGYRGMGRVESAIDGDIDQTVVVQILNGDGVVGS